MVSTVRIEAAAVSTQRHNVLQVICAEAEDKVQSRSLCCQKRNATSKLFADDLAKAHDNKGDLG